MWYLWPVQRNRNERTAKAANQKRALSAELVSAFRCQRTKPPRWLNMVPIDFKAAITQDIAEIDLALSVLNGLRNVNMARLALLQEAEKRA